MRKTVKYLFEYGPSPSGEFRDATYAVGPQDWMAGVDVLKVSSRVSSTGGNAESVYFLDHLHTPEEVIRVFFDSNPDLLRSATRRQLVSLIGEKGESWKEACTEVLNESGPSKNE